jgi:hypothetical protein
MRKIYSPRRHGDTEEGKPSESKGKSKNKGTGKSKYDAMGRRENPFTTEARRKPKCIDPSIRRKERGFAQDDNIG